MARVWNKKVKGYPKDATYVGRGSDWGNPFIIGKDGSRANVVEKYTQWLSHSLRARARNQLRGKDLLCFCAPEQCHADVLLEIANG